jgi:SAM-dependent methyltransferase
MKSLEGIGLSDVQAVYGGQEGRLWELIMGEQIHIGGFASSMDLADKAGIAAGSRGVDLCCCTGAGMRFLVRFCQAAGMTGVDATERVLQLGRQRCKDEGLDGQIEFVKADACATGLPGGQADFVWAEDAWCYVADKSALIAEAARLVRPGGVIAFTDWVEGPAGLSEQQAHRLLKFMKFPSIQDLAGYCRLLAGSGCDVVLAEQTGRFAPCVDLYLDMLNMQLTYDALKIIGFDTALMGAMAQEMQFMRQLAHEERIVQGLIIARKR